jgi:Spy/CpxP family protein refolding chaperone
MKRLFLGFAVISLFAIVAIAYAQGPGWWGDDMMGPGMMGERGWYNPYCEQYVGPRGGHGYGMGPDVRGMTRERKGHYRRWFQYGVTLMLQNADKLGLSDEQIKQLCEVKRKYSKDIINQDAKLKIDELDLRALLKESEINLSEVKEALKKVENSKTQIRYLRIMAFVEARKILTDEQKNSLKKLMEMRTAPGMRRMTTSSEPEEEGETQEE